MIAKLEETQMGMYSELRSCHHSAHAAWLFLVGPSLQAHRPSPVLGISLVQRSVQSLYRHLGAVAAWLCCPGSSLWGGRRSSSQVCRASILVMILN